MPACPRCGEDNPEQAKFCLACGASLAPEPAGRKERKFATALFADLVGSTTLAEREDPEVVQAVVSRAFDRLAQEIERYGGLLEKFMGDAVLAVFGVPKAHEDDPERAVRAAIEMQAVLSELNRVFVQEGKAEIQMRVGVEAGEVLVDLERTAGPRDRMLTGDAVNTAARLQAAAEPGHVVVGPAVYASTKDVIEYRELEPLDLKGKMEPVPAWDGIRVKARVRGERPALGLEARVVGRDEEMALLKQTLGRVRSEGRPALVTIVGPAGVGKSRLVRELLKYVEGLPSFTYWRNGRCLAYGDVLYSAFADAIKAQCEILEDDTAETVSAKVERAVVELFGDNAVSPQVETLIGSAPERAFTREHLFDAWRRFLERMAARYPLVLVLEDLHWADEGLLDFVDHLADWTQGPMMILATARAELLDMRPTWSGGKRNATSIFLEPLSPEEDVVMLEDLVPGGLPEDVKGLIVERSEGNPLFTEEIVRMLIDRGVLRATEAKTWELAAPVGHVELPRSIHGLIAARLDGLPDDEKAVLQDAAVVGRVFWTGALVGMSGRDPGDVREVLGHLRVKEIVVPHEPSSFSEELEFSFRHVLIRDGAYESLPKSSRAERHARAARWAEERAGGRAEELAELIATHYVRSLGYLDELGDASKARAEIEGSVVTWASAAADRATRLWQQSEATRWTRTALETAESAGRPAEELAPLARRYAELAPWTESYDVGETAARKALELSEAIGDTPGAGWAEARLAFLAFLLGRDDEVLPLVERAVVRLEPLGDGADLAEAFHTHGRFLWRKGHIEQAEPLLRRAAEMAERVGARALEADAMDTLGVCLASAGRQDEGIAVLEESHRIAKEIGDVRVLGRLYNNLSATLDYAGERGRAEAILREGAEVTRRAGLRSTLDWIVGGLGDLAIVSGRLDEAERYQQESLELAREIADAPLVATRFGALAWLRLLRGDVEEATRLQEEHSRLARDVPEPQITVWVHFVDGLLSRAKERHEEAVECFLRGIEAVKGVSVAGAEFLYPELVRTLIALGRPEEAAEHRHEALSESPPVYGPALSALIEGLLANEPTAAVARLREAAERYGELEQPIDQARCLIDLARAETRAGEDPRPSLERARDLLASCGAEYYLKPAEAELAALTR